VKPENIAFVTYGTTGPAWSASRLVHPHLALPTNVRSMTLSTTPRFTYDPSRAHTRHPMPWILYPSITVCSGHGTVNCQPRAFLFLIFSCNAWENDDSSAFIQVRSALMPS